MKTLKKYFKSVKIKSIKNKMRGYRILKEHGELELLIKIKDDISNTKITGIDQYSSKLFFGAGLPKAELIFRQWLILRFLNLDFNKKILISIGKGNKIIISPMPHEWRLVLEKHGFIANTITNKCIWFFHILLYFLYGFYVGISILINSVLKKNDVRNSNRNKSSVYFHGLNSNNLPISNNKSYDIINWYLNSYNKLTSLSHITHSVTNSLPLITNGISINYVNSAITNLAGWKQYFKYIKGLFKLCFFSLSDLIKGKYWHAVLLSESYRSFQFRILDNKQISSHYFFHNVDYIYKPIWTYDAEKNGSYVSLYFYSCNVERFKESDGYKIQPNSWQVMSWSNYLVWDKYQSDFVKRMIGENANIEIVGPIDFVDSCATIPELPKKTILIFDVQPQRDEHYQSYCTLPEYFIPEIVNNFIKDILIVAESYDYTVALKRKRHIGNLLNKRYKNFLQTISCNKNFISVDPDIAAIRLIKSCDIVISMPFTSTALIANNENKISIYYDPSGIIQKNDRGAHGIEIISGIGELEKWFKNIYKLQELE
jgi:polysaccharide biosynthesis PFTS motif protein